MTDDIEKALDMPVVFGLRAQGHIPTIRRMLDEGKTWDEIGKTINWCPDTARQHYIAMTEQAKTAIIGKIVDLLRQEGVKIDSPYDFENFMEISHTVLFKTKRFKTEE